MRSRGEVRCYNITVRLINTSNNLEKTMINSCLGVDSKDKLILLVADLTKENNLWADKFGFRNY